MPCWHDGWWFLPEHNRIPRWQPTKCYLPVYSQKTRRDRSIRYTNTVDEWWWMRDGWMAAILTMPLISALKVQMPTYHFFFSRSSLFLQLSFLQRACVSLTTVGSCFLEVQENRRFVARPTFFVDVHRCMATNRPLGGCDVIAIVSVDLAWFPGPTSHLMYILDCWKILGNHKQEDKTTAHTITNQK